MAVTLFRELYRFVRTFLNDLNPAFKEYSDNQIDSYIAAYVAADGTYVQDGQAPKFTAEIAAIQDKALLAAKVSLMVLEHSDTYSFNSKIYNVGSSERDVLRKIQALQDRIDTIENGSALAVDALGDWRAIFGLTATENTINDLDADLQGR